MYMPAVSAYLHVMLVGLAVLRLPLETMKCKIAENLRELEKFGVVSVTDNYQQIINAIAQVHMPAAIYPRRPLDLPPSRTCMN